MIKSKRISYVIFITALAFFSPSLTFAFNLLSEVQSTKAKLDTFKLSSDGIRLMNISDANPEKIRSLLSLESSQGQLAGKQIANLIDSFEGLIRNGSTYAHFNVSLIPDLFAKFKKDPSDSTLKLISSELEIINRFLVLQEATNRAYQQRNKVNVEKILNAYYAFVGSLDAKSVHATEKFLRKVYGGKSFSITNPYILEYMYKSIPLSISSDIDNSLAANQILALWNFASAVKDGMASPTASTYIFPLVMHLELRMNRYLNGKTSIEVDYKKRIGINEIEIPQGMRKVFVYSAGPGFGVYFDYVNRVEFAYLEIISAVEMQELAKGMAMDNIYQKLVQEKVNELASIRIAFNRIRFDYSVPFQIFPDISHAEANKDNFQHLVRDNLEARLIMLESASPLLEEYTHLKVFTVSPDFVSILSTMDDAFISVSEVQRFSEQFKDDPSLADLVINKGLRELVNDNLYGGILKTRLQTILEPQHNVSNLFFQRMFSLALSRALRAENPDILKTRILAISKTLKDIKTETSIWKN
ncbi:MAG: hypothetical protein HUU57_04965 [Bdellovibrio sp.]|nr:hypothetical protein [Bdellovibrio sp.]